MKFIIDLKYLIILSILGFIYIHGEDSEYMECGRNRKIDSETEFIFKDIDGKNSPGTWPWLISIGGLTGGNVWEHRCGGSLVTRRHVITAAHCARRLTAQIGLGQIYIRAGDSHLQNDTDDAGVKIVQVVSSTVHPDYRRTSRYADIGVLELTNEIELSDVIRIICLPKTATLRDQDNHRLLVVTGWGADIFDQVGQQLQETRVQVFEELYCNLTHLGEHKSRQAVPNGFSSDLFCAGDPGGTQGVCHGDSGSPAVSFQPLQKNYVLKGVVSGGLSCGTQDHPNIYVRVTDEKILNWVRLQISEIQSTLQTKTPTSTTVTTSKSAIPETDRSCPGLDTCETKETCPYIQKKYEEIRQAATSDKRKKVVSSLKSLVCNNQRKAFCCPAPGIADVCRTIVSRQANRRSDAPCVFPFIYKNVIYNGCTNVEDKRGRLWCSTKVDENYKHVKGEGEFGYCQTDCAEDPKGLRTVLNERLPFSDSTPVKYETHEELMNRFDIYAAKFPSLAATNSIGRSVEGRELKYLKITKDANMERKLLKPMVKLIANIHGDEPVGRQMLQYLAQDLLHNYNNGDFFAQFLVNNTEIYILPDMNPDGFSRSSPGPRPTYTLNYSCPHSTPGKVNAHGKDLNTDFPTTWTFRSTWNGSWASISAGRQPETVAIMDWTFNNPFVLSANFHSGALAASYPYDTLRPSKQGVQRRGLASETPDEDLFKKLASIYSENNIDMKNQRHENPNEWNRLHKCSKGYGGPFENGVTNGAAWGNLEGGMQDFNYAYTNCMAITLELSCCKYPPPELLENYWKNNRNSLLYYTEAAHLGVKGLVTDSDGDPIFAKITVKNNVKTVTTSSRGEYWRLLLPGNYMLTASADGYDSSTISIHIPQKTVDTLETPAQIQNFQLTKPQVNNKKNKNNDELVPSSHFPEENQNKEDKNILFPNKARSNQNGRRRACCRNGTCRRNKNRCTNRTGRRDVQG